MIYLFNRKPAGMSQALLKLPSNAGQLKPVIAATAFRHVVGLHERPGQR
jgi:hypothetical protein